MEKIGYQRGAEKKERIERKTHQRVKPKHTIIIRAGHVFPLIECRDKSALLQRTGNEGKDGEIPHHTVVGIGEQTSQKDTEHEVQQLLQTAGDTAP